LEAGHELIIWVWWCFAWIFQEFIESGSFLIGLFLVLLFSIYCIKLFDVLIL
jgi:hypothetical protein